MSPWWILLVLTAAANLFVFIAIRGRWGRLVPFLAVASLLGSALGALAGDRLRIGLVRIGSFEVVAASVLAQLAMLATVLLAALAPERPSSTDSD